MQGHTDRSTINERRPMTRGMRITLSWIASKPSGIHWSSMSTAEKNHARALRDRGYASVEPDGETHIATDAGHAALAGAQK